MANNGEHRNRLRYTKIPGHGPGGPGQVLGRVHADGLEAFKAAVAAGARCLSDRVDELKSFDDIKLLSVTVDRLRTWSKPGLLCIGDAAHAMSPVGGVGINLAIQDAVATANLLAVKLKAGSLRDGDLESVRLRRRPARILGLGVRPEHVRSPVSEKCRE